MEIGSLSCKGKCPKLLVLVVHMHVYCFRQSAGSTTSPRIGFKGVCNRYSIVGNSDSEVPEILTKIHKLEIYPNEFEPSMAEKKPKINLKQTND